MNYSKTAFEVNHCLLAGIILCVQMIACGGGSSSEEGGSSLSNVTGSLKASNGSLTDNANWAVVFIERDTGISRVGEVGLGGKFSINGMPISRPQTIIALNPSYVFQSVLSHADSNTVTGTVQQYFTMSGNTVPSLVENGQTLNFADTSSLSFQSDAVVDADGLGIPDGIETTSTSFSLMAGVIDTDSDGKLNQLDSDIDGDGIANWFDVDMDGNLVQNMFDNDVNGNEILDSSEENSDQHFPEGVEFFSPQVIQEIGTAGTTTSILFTVKVREGVSPTLVAMRGSDSLFGNATVSSVNENTGAESSTAWDLELSDDGESGDGEANDGTYAKKISLDTGVIPKPGQVVFARLQFGANEATASSKEYPYIFPEINPGTIAGSASGRTVSITGTPFVNSKLTSEAISNYKWSVVVYDTTEGYKIYSSDAFTADITSFEIETGKIEAGTYTANVVVQSEAKIPGIPNWTIRSSDFTITITN